MQYRYEHHQIGILGAANIAKKNIRALMLADPSLIGEATAVLVVKGSYIH